MHCSFTSIHIKKMTEWHGGEAEVLTIILASVTTTYHHHYLPNSYRARDGRRKNLLLDRSTLGGISSVTQSLSFMLINFSIINLFSLAVESRALKLIIVHIYMENIVGWLMRTCSIPSVVLIHPFKQLNL